MHGYSLLLDEILEFQVFAFEGAFASQLLGEFFDLDLVGVPVEIAPLDLPEPVYLLGTHPVWGLTARILQELAEVLEPVL